jgi:hypothetical protein
MGYASKAGRARTSATNPQAHAICDRCGIRYNHVDLSFQYDWAGAAMMKKNLLVCRTCMDRAQPQLRSIILPADPPPVLNPRLDIYSVMAQNARVVTLNNGITVVTGLQVPDDDPRIVEDGALRVTQGG